MTTLTGRDGVATFDGTVLTITRKPRAEFLRGIVKGVFRSKKTTVPVGLIFSAHLRPGRRELVVEVDPTAIRRTGRIKAGTINWPTTVIYRADDQDTASTLAADINAAVYVQRRTDRQRRVES